jgi:hypothetical protein
MPALDIGSELISLCVANLQLSLDALGTGIGMEVPAAHDKFLSDAADGGLALSVRDGRLRKIEAWSPLYAPAETWQLWRDEGGRYVFVPGHRGLPVRQVTIEPGFGCGEVIGAFGSHTGAGESRYPLQGIEGMIFVNWLAEVGDLILHAAGVKAGGRGYCFAGSPGAGKSTLAAALMSAPGRAAEAATTNRGKTAKAATTYATNGDGGAVVVLGEDNVILRYLEGRFWIFGTPWHLDSERCDPRGVPLEKLFFLDRTLDQGVVPCGPLEGVARLLQTAFVPYYRPAAVSAILARLELLSEQVPFYTLSYRLGSDVLRLISEG